ncbi:FliG C-terminal domain-containing protein [Aeoliella mucimassa]|nr:FliG C-terminal domain-containing protein [Aeoliella mucimassa]
MLRKAAILMRSLDAESAAVLLAQLSTEEARTLRQAMRELQEFDTDEQEELRSVLRPSHAVASAPQDTGVELSLTSSNATTYESQYEPHYESAPMPMQPATEEWAVDTNQPFGWLERGDLPSLASMLEREHLSTVAVVLSHLSPDCASLVLAALPPSRRSAALERLADLGESDRESLEVIERELAEWISVQKAERRRRADRMRSIQAILQHSSRHTSRSVMADIARHNEALAAEIGPITSEKREQSTAPKPVNRVAAQLAALGRAKQPEFASPRASEPRPVAPPVPQPAPEPVAAPVAVKPPQPQYNFNRIVELNCDQLADLFRRCPSERVVMALAGATEQVCDHVIKQLPKSIGKELRRRMHTLSAVRLSDFADAQQEVATVASKLFVERVTTSA